jgi:hypothetical protein
MNLSHNSAIVKVPLLLLLQHGTVSANNLYLGNCRSSSCCYNKELQSVTSRFAALNIRYDYPNDSEFAYTFCSIDQFCSTSICNDINIVFTLNLQLVAISPLKPSIVLLITYGAACSIETTVLLG